MYPSCQHLPILRTHPFSVLVAERNFKTRSFTFSGLLQPALCGDESLAVMETLQMETLQSVLLSVRSGNWMVSLDLKDSYLQVTIHPNSCKYLRFVALSQVYQFKALLFRSLHGSTSFHTDHGSGLNLLHCLGIRIRC